jgi:hypothetical protein
VDNTVVDEPSIVERAFAAFATETAASPPLSLRGGYDIDSYKRAEPFDPTTDRPTAEYIEQHAFWGLGYLDAQSWRHYLPRLIQYSLLNPDDPHMVTETLVRSLRPPDRYPPRLRSVTREQAGLLAVFLEHLTDTHPSEDLRKEARQALDEWWGPQPHSRPSDADVEALRRTPMTYRDVESDLYCLRLPDTLAGSGVREIPEESRRVETWGGYVCGDAHTVIAVNVMPLASRPLARAVPILSAHFRTVEGRDAQVPGAGQARRLDGLTHGDSPAEPQTLTILVAEAPPHLVTLTCRSWPREDLAREIERIVSSFAVVSV